MNSAAQMVTTMDLAPARGSRVEGARSFGRYIRRNPSLGVGIFLLVALLLFVVVGHLTVDTSQYRPLSVRPLQPPSWELPFGSDKQGRNLYAVMVLGTPLTLRIGLLAGVIGLTIGTILAFIAGYYGGFIDAVIRLVVDVGLTIPGLLVLIIIAMRVRGGLTVDQMALVVGLLAWLYPTRTIRSQVLTMKQRGYVQIARLSGMSNPEVIVKELLPNLLPYLGASLVGSVSAAILASIGLEVLGLGPFESPTLGMTIYWVNYNAAIINGWYWWWVPPILVIAILFIGLFTIAVGMDEVANPRVRDRV
ncbi:MAG: ABC transporter permease [Chloroflexota bacterium]|nr:ABC transporter permease [Chloroflexota bacterium]